MTFGTREVTEEIREVEVRVIERNEGHVGFEVLLNGKHDGWGDVWIDEMETDQPLSGCGGSGWWIEQGPDKLVAEVRRQALEKAGR